MRARLGYSMARDMRSGATDFAYGVSNMKTSRSTAAWLGLAAAPFLAASTALAQQAAPETSISLPTNAGSRQGMGESFRADLSTGTASIGLPIALVPARGAISVGLGISYSSSGGNGLAGQGWSMGVPFIARQTDGGAPRYIDPPAGTAWIPEQDRFSYNGNQLVPICLVSASLGCTGMLAGETLPPWSAGWRYFRPKIEGEFQRVFWSPDGKTWRIQDKSGLSLELGVPLDGSGDTNALETELPGGLGRVFRWNLSRQYDVHGDGNPLTDAAPKPYNVAKYRYVTSGGIAYLSDIYDTPPAAQSAASLDAFAHHARLVWATRADTSTSYRRGWATTQNQRLARVDITSKAFNASASPRYLVRRYHFTYGSELRLSQLASVQIEGRCATDEAAGGLAEAADGTLGASNCPKLPPVSFEYGKVTRADGSAPAAGPAGFAGIDTAVRSVAASPRDALNGSTTDLLDVNADGLPDVYHANAARFAGNHAVALNAATGAAGGFGNPVKAAVTPLGGVDAQALTFNNPNVVVFDPDGDGIVNFVNMPPFQRPAIFSPSATGSTFAWNGRTTTTSAELNPKIALANRNAEVRFADINGDGLVDVVVNAGVSIETYLSLGRYPNGDGKWGSATWTGANTVTLSANPLSACLPNSDSPVLFSDPTVKLVDINGDGLVDIVRARNSGIEYWPGRGAGVFGTGNPATCVKGSPGTNRHVRMTSNPSGIEPTGEQVQLLDDLNGDGLPDLALVRNGSTSVWFNVDGLSWSGQMLFSSPAEAPSSQLRLTDVDGSGTRDLLWANANSYRFIDLQGGKRAGLLTKISNGLGQQTRIDYTTSVAEMLAARAAGVPWTATAPAVVSVVKRVTVTDGLEALRGGGSGDVTEYNYRNPIYDGRTHSFRGFAETASVHVGDMHSPSMLTRVAFLTGQCAEDGIVGRCKPENAWMENPRESLRGLVRVMQIEDQGGVALSTRHSRYRLRNLYTGLDGAIVRHAFSTAETAFSYDVDGFVASPSPFSASDVEVERSAGQVVADTANTWTLPSVAGRTQASTAAVVDYFGNILELIDSGCASGCARTDEELRSVSRVERVPLDSSGWLFRPMENYTVGSSRPSEKRSRKLLDFDAKGHLLTESVDLWGTLALQRSHASGAAVAPSPTTASQNGIRVRARFEYDAHGNITKTRGSSGQCEGFVFTADYADFVTSEISYAGVADASGCGARALAGREEYDRGLNLTRRTWAFNGELAQYDYDGLGRNTKVWSPNPTSVGALASVPTTLFEYTLPTNPNLTPYLVIRTRTQDGATPETSSYHDTYTYVDARGRAIAELAQADTTSGDAGAWLVSGVGDRTAKGAPWREYEPFFWSGDATQFPVGLTPSVLSTTNWADAFERIVESVGTDGAVTGRVAYHGNSVDLWDAADLAEGSQAGTFMTQTKDGHGRLVSTVERASVGGALQAVDTSYTYLATGEVEQIRRQLQASAVSAVTRWFRYDSLGRMVLNVEPNTTKGFNENPATDPSLMKAWRYVYNDENQLVGTSDARGCGVNTHYDASGRIVAEDFSPCLASQAAYTAPNLTSGDGTESFYTYDTASPELATALPGAGQGLFLGRLSSISDRATLSVLSYDGRGRLVGVAKRMAKPGTAAATLASRYTARWYRSYSTFDGADRVVSSTTGAEVPELLASNGKSEVTTLYSKRGRVRAIDSSYGALISSITRNARGLSTSVVYGDVASTRSAFTFDGRSRLTTAKTFRTAAAGWGQGAPPFSSANQDGTTNQLVLASNRFEYDEVGNPTAIYDDRSPAEWPNGAKPVDRYMTYDGMSRISRVEYAYEAGEDTWQSPYDRENQTPVAQASMARPSPHVSFGSRIAYESFEYDWLGNNVRSGDDQNGFFDRSLGEVTSGTATQGPYQLKSASNRSSGGTRSGDLSASYDDAGNLISMVVRRDGACLPGGASCKQRFAYDWDEVGRLAGAKRWDLTTAEASSSTPPARSADVELRYGYDRSDERAIKTAVSTSGAQLHTLYIFQTLEQRRTSYTANEYIRDVTTEVPYLYSQDRRLGKVVVRQDMPNMSGGTQHVLLELADQLGSNDVVLDKATSELVERSTYQAYGNIETDYRPTRWQGYRSDYKFTGKEEDIEVGLQYFGKRYYAAKLNRWISADPLAIHQAGADLNAYAYVHGKPFVSVDPNGECEILCAMAIGALISMAIDTAVQTYHHDGDISKIDGLEVAFAGVAGMAGGAAGSWIGAAVTRALATPLGALGAEFVGSVVGGMSGSVTSGVTFRSQMSGRLVARGDQSIEQSIEQTFNPKSMSIDAALGAAGGILSFGVNQILKSAGTGARSTKAPSQSNSASRLTPKEVGQVGEAAGAQAGKATGATGAPMQNSSGHGLDWVGKTKSGEIVVVEAKASSGGRPPALSKAQSNMSEYLRNQLEKVASGRGNFSAADKVRATELLDALQKGAPVRGIVVETRYTGSGSQFTTTRPWTTATRSGQTQAPRPTAGNASGPGPAFDKTAPSATRGSFASTVRLDHLPVLPITCYTKGDGGARCDTTVVSW